jgi:hypothetical protein
MSSHQHWQFSLRQLLSLTTSTALLAAMGGGAFGSHIAMFTQALLALCVIHIAVFLATLAVGFVLIFTVDTL